VISADLKYFFFFYEDCNSYLSSVTFNCGTDVATKFENNGCLMQTSCDKTNAGLNFLDTLLLTIKDNFYSLGARKILLKEWYISSVSDFQIGKHAAAVNSSQQIPHVIIKGEQVRSCSYFSLCSLQINARPSKIMCDFS
jgi:hypothetical protein